MPRCWPTSPPPRCEYAPTQGHAGLRAWVAERYGAAGADVVITHGSQQALELLVRALVDPGREVAISDPGYVGALQALRLSGARLVGIPSDRDGMQVDVLADRLAAGARPAVVYVVSSFDNPTGATLSAERRATLAGLADRYGFVVVDDDPYGELRWSGAAPTPLRQLSDRVVTLGTTSKILSPGLRVGWAIAPPDLAATLVLLKQAVDLQTATFAQHVAHRVLRAPSFLDAHLAALRHRYARQCGALTGSLREHLGGQATFETPEGGMFLWARLAGHDTRRAASRGHPQWSRVRARGRMRGRGATARRATALVRNRVAHRSRSGGPSPRHRGGLVVGGAVARRWRTAGHRRGRRRATVARSS